MTASKNLLLLGSAGLFAWGILSSSGAFGSAIVGGVNAAGGVSAAGRAFIKANEGLKLTPYQDGAYQAIGYGHTIQPGDNISGAISAARAEQLFEQDLQRVESTINSVVRVPLTQGQYDALADLIYNIGASAFSASTLLQLLNAGDYAGAGGQFGRWIYSGGSVNPGLVSRRASDLATFSAGTPSQSSDVFTP